MNVLIIISHKRRGSAIETSGENHLLLKDILLAITVALIWGVNFVMAKFGLHHFPPLFLMGIRFALVAAVLLPFSLKPRVRLRDIFLLSVTYGVGYHALLFTAVYMGIDVATSIVSVQMNVPFTSLIGALYLKDHLGWRRILGMVIAFAGIILIVGSPTVLSHKLAFAMVIMAAFCWAMFNVHVKTLGKIDILPFLAWVSLFTAILLFTISAGCEHGQLQALMTTTPMAALSIIYMAILSTIVAFGLWFYLLHHYSVHQVVPFSMLMPVFGIVAAIIMLHEQLSWHVALGGAVTIVGVTIIVLRRPKLVAEGAAVS